MSQTAGTTEKPRWSLPNGNVDADVANYYFRSDTPTGRSVETPPPDVVQKFRQLITAGAIVPENDAARNFAQSQGGWLPGDQTPLGPLINDMPGGLTPDYWRVVIDKASTEAQTQLDAAIRRGYFGNVSPAIDPATGQFNLDDPNLTVDARMAMLNYRNQVISTETARRLADTQARQVDLQDAQATAQRAEAARQFNATFGEQARQFDLTTEEGRRQFNATFGEGARQFDLTTEEGRRQFNLQNANAQAQLFGGAYANGQAGPGGTGTFTPTEAAREFNTQQGGWLQNPDGTWTQTLGAQQQAFAQQQAAAENWANPRNYLTAAMAGQSRGGLGGFAPTNGIAPTTGFVPPGMQNPANPATPFTPTGQAGPTTPTDFSSPGSPAPGQPATMPGASGQQVPVTAFGAALLQNRAVPIFGALQTQGGYADAARLQAAINPSQWRPQDYYAGRPSEQQQANALASFGGYSDQDTAAALQANLPKFRPPSGAGALA